MHADKIKCWRVFSNYVSPNFLNFKRFPFDQVSPQYTAHIYLISIFQSYFSQPLNLHNFRFLQTVFGRCYEKTFTHNFIIIFLIKENSIILLYLVEPMSLVVTVLQTYENNR